MRLEDIMITPVDKVNAIKFETSSKKSGMVTFSATRYMAMLSAAEKKVSVNAVKRNLDKEAKRIKNSGADSAQINRALQKIKHIKRKADEKIALLNREEKKKAASKRAEDAGKKEEAKKLKKRVHVEKYFRKSNEHGNIVRTAITEKDELNKNDYSTLPSGTAGCEVNTQQPELAAENIFPESVGIVTSSIDIKA